MGKVIIFKCDNCKKESIDTDYWLKVRIMGEFVSKKFYFCSTKCMINFFNKYKITYDEGVPMLELVD